jgi:hypothetical protein
MNGYLVVTGNGRPVGRVVESHSDFLVVEVGRVRRSRRAVPLEFAHPLDAERRVRITVPVQMLRSSPRVNGTLDERAAAAYYGVAA